MFPHKYTSVYPYAPGGRLPGGPGGALPDPLIWMAAMAAVTTRLRFMTGVIILPLRNPMVLAKQVATLDHMSGGRIELGIGVGWLKEEFEALGIPFEKRGARSDEYIAVMRKLWAEDGVSFDGQFVKFDEVSSNPKPVGGSVPIVIGGHSEAAAKRAGRLGDGFFPSIGAQVDTVPLFNVVRRDRRRGRPRPAGGRDHGRLPRPAARLDSGPARRDRGAGQAGRQPDHPAGLALPARPRGRAGPVR